ncbi:MAG: hypothetical protein ABI210_07100 [Abditibacteriaceae bacterium]
MKNLFLRYSLIAISLFTINSVVAFADTAVISKPAATDQKIIPNENPNRQEFVLDDISNTNDDAEVLSDLNVSVITNKLQSITDGGIHLTLTITNNGKQQISFANPLDSLSVLLLDKEGRIVSLTGFPRGLIDAVNYDGTFYLPFKLTKVLLNEQQLTEKEIKTYVIELPAKAKLEIHIEIDKIREVKQLANNGQGHRETISIPTGDYYVRIQQSLRAGNARNENRRTLSSDFTAISLVSGNIRDLTSLGINADTAINSSQDGSIVEGFQLVAQTSKETFDAGEPVAVTVSLKNISDKMLSFPSGYFNEYQVTVKDSNGNIVPLTRYSNQPKAGMKTNFGIGPMDLFKGEETQRTFLLNRLYDLTEVGEYSVSIKRYVFKQNTIFFIPIVANTIHIKIVEPRSGSQMEIVPSSQKK